MASSHPGPRTYLARFFDEYGQCSVSSQMFDAITPAWFCSLHPAERPAALRRGQAERSLIVGQLHDDRSLFSDAPVRRVHGWGRFPMIVQPEQDAAEVAALAPGPGPAGLP